MITTVDNFLDSFGDLRAYADTADFSIETNDVDGAVYPAINFDIPSHVENEFIRNIEKVRGFRIDPKLIFLRANPKGSPEPYQAHNDLNMGDYTCIVYLTSDGGTSFVEHKETGLDRNSPEMADIWEKDCNNFNAWNIKEFCPMAPNKALFFDAELMHRGEPVEGYGSGNDARMIMVCFYSKAELC